MACLFKNGKTDEVTITFCLETVKEEKSFGLYNCIVQKTVTFSIIHKTEFMEKSIVITIGMHSCSFGILPFKIIYSIK